MDFLKGAKDLTKNPLGIVALFISLIYGIASFLLGSSADKLTCYERWPLIIFIVIFPIFILLVFYKLVTEHHGKLYAPGDFKDDGGFLKTLSFLKPLSPEEREIKLEEAVSESLGDKISEDGLINENNEKTATKGVTDFSPVRSEEQSKKVDRQTFKEEIKKIEDSVIRLIASELKIEPIQNVGVGGTNIRFDAFFPIVNEKATFLEVKAFRTSFSAMMALDRLLYNALVADRFFEAKFKLIIVVVYYDDNERERIERSWRRKIESCPVEIELRFMSNKEVTNILVS